ncbi:MAG: hypothetical protein JSV62_11665 [Promethearchaeota archaeon]|nr:MAG: hypothetical protein JSV62_11665 [Candidatus Lokiarchaeota archaeon]
MNFTRKELIQTDATMNQMRNSIHILASLMEKNGISDLKDRLRRMGKNIARTYLQYWKPTDRVQISNLKDVITTIYQKVLNSSISVEINNAENIVRIQDYSCSLCKYHYEDVEIAGCEILLGLLSEYINLLNKESNESEPIFLEPYEVIDSRAYGNKSCIQVFKYKIGKGD